MKIMDMSEQEKLNISDETMHSIKQFFLNTSIPRLIEKKKQGGNKNE